METYIVSNRVRIPEVGEGSAVNRFFQAVLRGRRAVLPALSLALLLGFVPAAHAKDYVQSAKTYLEKDQLRTAVIELKNALQEDPNNAEARVLLGTTYLRAGDPVSAEKELQRAAELGAKRDQWLAPLGEALLWRNKADEVLERLQVQAGDARSLQLQIHVARASAALAKNDMEAARKEFEQAKAIDPNNAKVLLLQAHLVRQSGDGEQATQLVERAIQADPRYVDAYLMKGRLLYFHGQYDQAIDAYKQATAINPHNPNARTAKAAAHIALKQFDAAEKELNAMGPIADRLILTRYMRALVTLGRGNLDETENQLREVLRIAPDFPPAHLLLGAVTYQRGQLETAESHLSRYVAMDPSNARAAKLLAVVRLKLKNPDGALQVLEPRVPLAQNDAQFLAILGTAYMKKGDYSKGSEYLNQAATLAPDTAAIRTQLGISQLGAGETDKATAELETAVQLDPDMLQADLLLVLVHLRQGQYDKAVEAAQQMVKRHPNDPLSHNVIGAAYLGKGDKKEAQQYFEKALAIDPKFTAARVNLARLAQANGDAAGARKHLEDALKQDPGNLRVLLALAQLAEQNGDVEAVRRRLEQARDANPDAIEPRVLLARFDLTRNEPLKALATARSLANDHPRHPAVLRTLGQVQLAAGETASGVVTFERLVALEPKSEEAHYLLADAHLKNNSPDSAAAELKQALDLNPKFIPALVAQVGLNTQQGKPEQARSAAKALQKHYPDSGIGYQLEGGVEMESGHFDKAEKALQQAYERNPNTDVVLALYRSRQQLGKKDEAVSTLTDWLEKNPNDARVRFLLAARYETANERQQAISQYERILSSDHDNVVALNNLAWSYWLQGDARAESTAERAYKASPNKPEVMDTYGWILVQNGKLEKGVTVLREAAVRGPHIPSIRYHLAAALDKNGDRQQAVAELKRLLQSGENFPEADAAKELLQRLSAEK